MFRVSDGDGHHALEENQRTDRFIGTGVISGGAASEGANPMELAFTAPSVMVDYTEFNLSAFTIDFEQYVDEKDPRKVLAVIDDTGTPDVIPGEPEPKQPSDEDRFRTFRPAPPDLENSNYVVLAEVYIDAAAQQITDPDFQDRRFFVKSSLAELRSKRIEFGEIVDGNGDTYTNIAGASEIRSDQDIRDVIGAWTGLGDLSQLDYFSGSHLDLTDVSSDDHHVRYADSEARTAVEGSVDVADLVSPTASNGDVATANSNGGVDWNPPARAESPVEEQGVITRPTGDSSAIKLTNVSADTDPMLVTDVTINDNEAYDGDLKFNYDAVKHWDSANLYWNVYVTISYETDPGVDIDFDYVVYNVEPLPTTQAYSDSQAIEAQSGAAISPAEVSVADRLLGPVVDEFSEYSKPTKGCMVVASGNGTPSFGQYIHDGTSFQGPFASGVTALSGLTIDQSKDWNAKEIKNLGIPNSNSSAARVQDVIDHDDERTLDRRSFALDSASGTEYFKIAKLNDNDGTLNASLFNAKPINDSTPRSLYFSLALHNGTSSYVATEHGSASDRVHFVVTKDGTTGDFYLYAKSTGYCRAKVVVEHANTIEAFQFQSGLSSTDLIGSVVHDTDTDGLGGTAHFHTVDATEVHGDKVFDNGNRVHTDQTFDAYTDTDTKSVMAGQVFTLNIPRTTLKAGQTIETWIDYLGSTNELGDLRVIRAEWQDQDGTHPDGGYFDLMKDGNVVSSEQYNKIGTYSSPYHTFSTGGRIAFRIRNNTGSEMDVSGLMQYTIG